MSRYLLKEHLVLTEKSPCADAAKLLQQRLLAFSMSLMPRGKVLHCELALRAGKQLHAFAGKLPTPDFYGIIQALGQEEDLEFIGFYRYDWESFWTESQGADPYTLESFFLKRGKTEGAFYSSYSTEAAEPGELFAYGEKEKKQYRGVVPFVPLQTLPETGRWFAPDLDLHCTQEDLKKINIHSLLPVCRRLCNLGGQQELYFAGHCFHFSLQNLELHSKEQIGRYLSLSRALGEVSCGLCSVSGELADLSAADPRVLACSRGPQGQDRLQITML